MVGRVAKPGLQPDAAAQVELGVAVVGEAEAAVELHRAVAGEDESPIKRRVGIEPVLQ